MPARVSPVPGWRCRPVREAEAGGGKGEGGMGRRVAVGRTRESASWGLFWRQSIEERSGRGRLGGEVRRVWLVEGGGDSERNPEKRQVCDQPGGLGLALMALPAGARLPGSGGSLLLPAGPPEARGLPSLCSVWAVTEQHPAPRVSQYQEGKDTEGLYNSARHAACAP